MAVRLQPPSPPAQVNGTAPFNPTQPFRCFDEEFPPLRLWHKLFGDRYAAYMRAASRVPHADWHRCEAAESPCCGRNHPRECAGWGSLPGCCETGIPDPYLEQPSPGLNATFAWLRETAESGSSDGYIVFSVSTSDPACSVERSIKDLLRHTKSGLIVVHVGCGSTATRVEREGLRNVNPERVMVNPICVPTNRTISHSYGSVLHAHLVNVGMLSRLADEKMIPEPSHFVLVAADMVWLKSNVERYVKTHDSSALRAGIVLAHSPKQLNPLSTWSDADWQAIVTSNPQLQLLNLDVWQEPHQRYIGYLGLRQKHEGSFYPWATARAFYKFLLSRGPLGRLNFRACSPCSPLCLEESYWPTFALHLMRVPAAENHSELHWEIPGTNPPPSMARWLTTARNEPARRGAYFGTLTMKGAHGSARDAGVFAEKRSTVAQRGTTHAMGCK